MSERRQQVKICWRATFQQPIGALNPSGFPMKAEIAVELRKQGGNWHAFKPGSRDEFKEITPQPLASTLKRQMMTLYFVAQVSDWVAYEAATGQQLNCEKFALDDQEKAWRIEA